MTTAPLRLRRVADPTAETGYHYETPNGRFEIHKQSNAEYDDQPDREPGTPPFLWDIYEGEELVETVQLLRHARALLAGKCFCGDWRPGQNWGKKHCPVHGDG